MRRATLACAAGFALAALPPFAGTAFHRHAGGDAPHEHGADASGNHSRFADLFEAARAVETGGDWHAHSKETQQALYLAAWGLPAVLVCALAFVAYAAVPPGFRLALPHSARGPPLGFSAS